MAQSDIRAITEIRGRYGRSRHGLPVDIMSGLNDSHHWSTSMSNGTDAVSTAVLEDTLITFRRQKELAERALAQVTDDDFFRTIDAESNSIAILVKHIGGNLVSRWTEFLTTDGEKPSRDRDGEFVVASAKRAAIMSLWETGWLALFNTFAHLRPGDLMATVTIRGEAMTALAAMHRGLAHISQHVGQIVMLAKHYRSAEWQTLSIPRGQSRGWQAADPTKSR